RRRCRPSESEVRERHARGEGPRAARRDAENDRRQSRLIKAARNRGRAGVDRHVPWASRVTPSAESGTPPRRGQRQPTYPPTTAATTLRYSAFRSSPFASRAAHETEVGATKWNQRGGIELKIGSPSWSRTSDFLINRRGPVTSRLSVFLRSSV